MKLKNELKIRKISQIEVAEYVGVSRPTISKRLNSPDTFSAQEIRLISEMMNVDDTWAYNNLFI
jgi:transcriptional regulator with XRE-family HTH domain|tara:strand:- start:225 stop:416 length:192 start_codon:yes stop_codon:yes gene_type:complete